MGVEPLVSVRESVDLTGVARQLGTTEELARQLVCSAVIAAERNRPFGPRSEFPAYDRLQRVGRNHIRIVSADRTRPAISIHVKRKPAKKPAIPEVQITRIDIE